jgi:hypothetical protein
MRFLPEDVTVMGISLETEPLTEWRFTAASNEAGTASRTEPEVEPMSMEPPSSRDSTVPSIPPDTV